MSVQDLELVCIMFYIVILVLWCGGYQDKVVVYWPGIVAQSWSLGLDFSVEIL